MKTAAITFGLIGVAFCAMYLLNEKFEAKVNSWFEKKPDDENQKFVEEYELQWYEK